MKPINQNNIFFRYWRATQHELLAWARLPLETKFVVALILIIISLITSNLAPIFSSVTNVWGLIVFFEGLIQKNLKWEKWDSRDILVTYLAAGIIGTVLASFLLLYFDVIYYLKLSLFDLLTRYIWFLLPISRLHKYLLPSAPKQNL
jgi:hypothetical protein